jgi:hypothetical protein
MPQIGNLMVSVYREESKHCSELIAAMCAAQPEFEPVVLDSTGYRNGQKYRYASIKSIRRATQVALAKHGLLCHHIYGHSDEGEYVVTVLRHVSGEYIASTLRIPSKDDVQESKAAKTLLCRTAIEGLLGIVTEDDDDGACVTVDPAKQSQWKSNLDLALKAIASARSEADVIRYATLAADRIKEGTMAQDAMVEINTKCDERRAQLQGGKNVDNARFAGTEGPDASRSRGGSPDREQGGAAATGRADVRSGDKRTVGTAG